MIDSDRAARLAAFGAIALWGVSFVATKVVLEELDPIPLVVARFALGAAFLHVVLLVCGRPLVPPRRHWSSLALMGVVGVTLHQSLQVQGLVTTTATNTGWLIGLIPIWTALLAAGFRGEAFGPRRVAGLVLGLVGTVLVVTRGVFGAAVLLRPAALGDALVFASTWTWAIYTLVGRETLRELGPLRAVAASMAFGWVLLLPGLAAREGWTAIAGLSGEAVAALLFLGLGCSGLGYLLWYGALSRLEAGDVSAFLYLEPLVTMAAAALWIGERILPVTVAGGLLVVAGVALVQSGSGEG